MRRSLYHVAVLRHEGDSPGDPETVTSIILDHQVRLAENERRLRDEILVEVGPEHKDYLDELEIIIRPF